MTQCLFSIDSNSDEKICDRRGHSNPTHFRSCLMNACVFAHRLDMCFGPPGSPSWRRIHAWQSPGHRVGRPRGRLLCSGARPVFLKFVERTLRPASALAARRAAARSLSAHTRCWALSLTKARRWRTRTRSMAAMRRSHCLAVGAIAEPQWQSRRGQAKNKLRDVLSRTGYIYSIWTV